MHVLGGHYLEINKSAYSKAADMETSYEDRLKTVIQEEFSHTIGIEI